MIKKFFTKKIVWIPLLVILLLGIAFGVFQLINQGQSAVNSLYQTSPLAKGSLTATVGATGTVRAKQTAVLNWQTTGTIESVFVEVGDEVTKDTRLAELSQTSLSQQIILAQAELVSAKRNLENLEKSNLASSQAEQALALALKQLDDAKEKRESKKFTKADQSIIDSAYANFILAREELEKYEDDYFGTQYKTDDDPVRAAAVAKYSAAKQKMETALANYNYAKSYPDELEQAEIDANLSLAEAKVKDAQREYDRMKEGSDPDDIAAAKAKVAATEATLKMAYMEAPFSGTVTDVKAKIGDQVSMTSTGFRIDDLTHLYADINVTEVDINRIKVGQEATLTFDAIQEKTYNARVTDVSSVGTSIQGVVNFLVTVEILEPDEMVRPGMTTAVNIVVNQMDDILVIPNRAVRLVDGNRAVYVLKNNMPTPVNITIGASSDTNSELLSGDLKEGDLIILNPPTMNMFGGM